MHWSSKQIHIMRSSSMYGCKNDLLTVVGTAIDQLETNLSLIITYYLRLFVVVDKHVRL